MRRVIVLSVLLTVTIAVGQHWEFEQVDTAGWGTGLEMRWHPDGRLFLCYGGSDSGNLRVAWRDSVWLHEDIPASIRTRWPGAWHSFDISPGGALGVSFADTAMRLQVAEKLESVWTASVLPFMHLSESPMLAYDTAGSPVVAFGVSLGVHDDVGLLFASCEDSVWTSDTARWLGVSGYANASFQTAGFVVSPEGRSIAMGTCSWSPWDDPLYGRPWYDISAFVVESSGDSWVIRDLASAWNGGFRAMSLALDGVAAPHWCYLLSEPPEPGPLVRDFYCDFDRIDTGVGNASLIIDSLGNPHIVYTQAGLHYRYRNVHSEWRFSDVLSSTDIRELDLVHTDSGTPIVAYTTSDGVWVSCGIDITGCGEVAVRPSMPVRYPTILRTAELARMDCRVLDITGRDVTARKARLTPGIYFLKRNADGGKRPAFRKVVIQR